MYDKSDIDHTIDMIAEANQMAQQEIIPVQQLLRPQPVGIEGRFYPNSTPTPEKLQNLMEILRETIALQLDIPEESITIRFI